MKNYLKIQLLLSVFLVYANVFSIQGQELNCKVSIDFKQIQGTNTDIFANLEKAMTEFLNERAWTHDKYALNERISCSLLFTVKEYSDEGTFSGEMIIQSSRPVYGASYTTPILNFRDNNISFTYKEFDQLEFRIEQIDNNLTALLAYYAYLIIGMDMDSMAPMGGTDVLQNAEAVVNAAQTFSEPGWKAYDDTRNRHGILTDYVNEGMKSFRQMMYDYHRTGLDDMAGNVGRGRAQVTTALEELQAAYKARSMSALPQLFTETKRDELINIYSKAPSSEKEKVYNLLSDINPSLNTDWNKIKSTANPF